MKLFPDLSNDLLVGVKKGGSIGQEQLAIGIGERSSSEPIAKAVI